MVYPYHQNLQKKKKKDTPVDSMGLVQVGRHSPGIIASWYRLTAPGCDVLAYLGLGFCC